MFITYSLITLLFLYLILELLLYFLLKRIGIIIDEFPQISPNILNKYHSFNSYLGWEPKPNFTKRNHANETIYSINSQGGRHNPICNKKSPYEVSSFGDSFCFCRSVKDNETWQFYLSNKLHVNVHNYGVGNYGLDQSILRLKKHYENLQSKYVVIAITPLTIERILSVWKHYSEPGNILAAKPRFQLQDGKLKFIENCIKEKDDFLNIEKNAEWLRKYDYHYKNYYKKNQPRKLLFTLFIIKNFTIIKFTCLSILRKVLHRFNITFINKIIEEKILESTFSYQTKMKYLKQLFSTHQDLFLAELSEFVNYSISNKFNPILLIMPLYDTYKFMKKSGNFYKDTLLIAKTKFPDLAIIDLFDYLEEQQDISSLFSGKMGGHYSFQGNQLVAEILHKEIINQEKSDTTEE